MCIRDSYLSLPDASIEIKLTPNRADCFSVRGIAFDVAAACGSEAVSYTHLDVYKRQDLQSDDYETALAVVHQRFSTHTFPTWALSHPFRTLAHNGEINTVRGNRNWLNSRASDFENQVWQG